MSKPSETIAITNRYCVAYLLTKGAKLIEAIPGKAPDGRDEMRFHFSDADSTRKLRSEYTSNCEVSVLSFESQMEFVWDIIRQWKREQERLERERHDARRER